MHERLLSNTFQPREYATLYFVPKPICSTSAFYTFRTWGEIQTDRYLRQLEDCCQLLADNPALGRQCDEIRLGLRRMKQGKHVVFYRQEPGSMLGCRIRQIREL